MVLNPGTTNWSPYELVASDQLAIVFQPINASTLTRPSLNELVYPAMASVLNSP